MDYQKLVKQLVALYKQTATQIPADVANALIKAQKKEKKGSLSAEVMAVIIENLRQAEITGRPMCQDTGTPIFFIWFPKEKFDHKILDAIQQATKEATCAVPLRHNAVRISDNKNMNMNFPEIHVNFWPRKYTEINLILKGGGSENVSQIFKLPESARNEKGIVKYALKTVYEAQGKGCAPGILGIAAGGTMTGAVYQAKKQLLRQIGERSEHNNTAKLEGKIFDMANELGIGPMGLGGKTTLLDVFVKNMHTASRHPATYFLAVSYMCYADRRGTMTIKANRPSLLTRPRIKWPAYEFKNKQYKKIIAPIKKDYQLKAGDRVMLSGEVTTARDRAHKYLLQTKKKPAISNVIYHCGVLADCDQCIAAAGPTTSARMDEYENKVVKKYKIKGIVGKGGMNKLAKGTIYFEGIGGVGVIPAKMMAIKKGYKKEFGMPEAIWNLDIKSPGIPLLVTMDAKGRSLYDEVREKSRKKYERLIKEANK